MNEIAELEPRGREIVGVNDRVRLTNVSLDFEGELSFEEWSATGRSLQRVGRAWQWWVGDWLNRGEQLFGEEYAQEIDVSEWDNETIRGATWVSSKIPRSRRRPGLSWSHHHAVAALEDAEQERFLDLAENGDLSVARLRELIKQYKKRLANPEPEPEKDDEMPEEYGSPEDADVDPIEDLKMALEEAHQEIERLHARIESLTEDDKDREIVQLHERVRAVELRLRAEMRSGNEAKKQAGFYSGQMREIRKLLRVEKTKDVVPTLRARLEG